MPSLAEFIASQPLADTHEHLVSEQEWTSGREDILHDLFDNYSLADLGSAGCPQPALQGVLDHANPDVAERFAAVEPYWRQTRFTGYGQAVLSRARLFYGLSALTPELVAGAAPRAAELRQPGQRLRLLRDVANLLYVQVDNFVAQCPPDPSGPEFFLYDLSVANLCRGDFDPDALARATGVQLQDPETLAQAIAELFRQHGPTAIAVKTQHAYSRTLAWQPRDDREVAAVLRRKLQGEPLERPAADLLGDWCLGQVCEQCRQWRLPLKIHTGYLAGNGYFLPDDVRPGHLAGLIGRHPEVDFVLMHLGWPYADELLALAKHFPNVYADCCWAWSINPAGAMRLVREFIHTAPLNKLLIFGGDARRPTASVSYAVQCRQWLTRALEAEVAAGDLSERDAIAIAGQLMQHNAAAVFDLPGTRQAIRAAG